MVLHGAPELSQQEGWGWGVKCLKHLLYQERWGGTEVGEN